MAHMHFNAVGAIFERVIRADFLAGKLAGLAQHQLTKAQHICQSGRHDKATCLNTRNKLRIGVHQRR